MKMTFKELHVNPRRDSLELIVYGSIRKYLPKECLPVIKGIQRVCGFTYGVKLDIDIEGATIKNALFRVSIPPDMRKRITVDPYYRFDDTYTVIDRVIDDKYVIVNIREYQCIDTYEGPNDILINAEKISFRISDSGYAKKAYYSLYVDDGGIIRMHNRDEIREDNIYIIPDIEYGQHLTLFPGYVKKGVYCRGSINYSKRDRIVIDVLMYNSESTKYCLRRKDSLVLPPKYMEHIRQVLNIRKWG